MQNCYNRFEIFRAQTVMGTRVIYSSVNGRRPRGVITHLMGNHFTCG